MKTDVFIPTANFQELNGLCNELLGPVLGVEMAEVTGRAGRGKTTAAKRIFATNEETIYVLYQEGWSPLDVLRDICFRLAAVRPRTRQQCFDIIEAELQARRRLILVDEADRMNAKCLNTLRNIHDIFNAPILLIGEPSLTTKMAKERRLMSRVRRQLAFGPVAHADIIVFYATALDIDLSREQAAALLKSAGGSKGDFRKVLTDAVALERMVKASGVDVTDAEKLGRVVAEVCKD